MKRHISDYEGFSMNEGMGMGMEMPRGRRDHGRGIIDFEISLAAGEYYDILPDLFDSMERNNVLFRVENWQGRQGGNPEMYLTGARSAIERVLREVLPDDADDMMDLMP